MTNIWIGEKLSFGAAVWDFCGQYQNGIYINEVVINEAPAVKLAECQTISGIRVTFKLVGIVGVAECANCAPGKVYLDIGTATTDQSGIAYINDVIVSNDYSSAYIDSVSLGYSLRVIACITDPKGQTVINHKCSDAITVTTQEYTETLRAFIRPWGWYTLQGAVVELTKKMDEINAKLFEVITFDKTGYSYVKTDITTEGEDVILNIRIRRSQIQTMVVPIAYLVYIVIAAIIAIVGFIIGLIWKTDRTEVGSNTPKESDEVPPEQQKPLVGRTIGDWSSKCLSAVPENNATCDEISSYALCLDVGHIATYGVLTAVRPNFEPFAVTYAKYNGAFKKLADECDPNVPGKTPADIIKDIGDKVGEYKKETDDNFVNLQNTYNSEHNCWIKNPWDGCLLSSSTGNTIVGTIAIVAVIGVVYWAITRRPAQTRIAVETTGRYIKGAAKAATEEVSRARAGYSELTSKQVTPTATQTQRM